MKLLYKYNCGDSPKHYCFIFYILYFIGLLFCSYCIGTVVAVFRIEEGIYSFFVLST